MNVIKMPNSKVIFRKLKDTECLWEQRKCLSFLLHKLYPSVIWQDECGLTLLREQSGV